MGPASNERSWEALFDGLLNEQPAIARQIRDAIKARLSTYRDLPDGALDSEVGLEVERVLRSARAGRAALDDTEVAELAAIGEARAHQGVPVAEMLRAWRIGVDVVVGYAREVGRRLGIEDAQVLEFVQSTLAWSDVAMVTTAEAHRKAELARALSEEEERAAFVRGALFGTIAAGELRVRAEAHGLDPAAEYVAVRARLVEKVPARMQEQALGFQLPGQRRRGLAATIEGDIAGFMLDPPPREVDGVIGFGPPRSLDQLAESYRLAARALMTAEACGLRGAHDLASLGVRAAVAMDKDVGELFAKRYLEPLASGGSASELVATLRAYLACGLHVERTATRLFVHQNTVRYRLTRFEELTGSSLRDTDVLLELWWALEFSGMRL
ncbi:PucR family transcriptional regulator [Mycobacterium hubeiense]|uniref:PucR family transcriptional regulator n=1 Tax=Mycobacterium hubeiense TaxID=1867256 RepID=UPI000C7F591D|nr:PucR family transcriptional regulator [Mycobacterium sp. QGD 101]